ncbi:MAG: hypothetical protein JW776_10855 [Candidatus Lokiarchaeota archaeon]|nr:hypothetical protein [Candidatus Lokiarchaeota archaeon]
MKKDEKYMVLNENEQFIIDLLRHNNNRMNYKQIQIACENEFEGVRLILKALKEKGYVYFDETIPGFSSEIELIREA